MAEMVVALPFLLALVTALVSFGITINHYIALTDAVRAGARAAAVSANVADPVATTQAAVANAAADLDQSQLPPASVRSNWHSGQPVTVTETYPFTISVFGLPVWSGNLQSSTTERVE